MNRVSKTKKITILGSTGSIGVNALNIARHLSSKFEVVAIAARSNIDLLEQQAKEFHPKIIAVYEKEAALVLQKRLPGIKVVGGMEGLQEAAAHDDADLVISAMSGSVGILPTAAAIKKGKQIGLANKEVLVAAGAYITALAEQFGSKLLPIDSEHSALFQCLDNEDKASVRRLILTASGGPFWHRSKEELGQITVEQALAHPNWKMGPKITVDCSTLMNKGLEVIEAHFLFGTPIEKIEVVVHPQSVIHSMVEYIDGSMLAQMSEPNMLIPIQYAMTYPERQAGVLPPFDFTRFAKLEFYTSDPHRFPCLELAFEALRMGGTAPCYLNAANEALVHSFLQKEISWSEIGTKLERLLNKYKPEKRADLDVIQATDLLARNEALEGVATHSLLRIL
ncbi:MAG TPA: 1-deoxy-D-xylulose-5-phosphate reductoisomerase [Rhabdochlamydiaceae bacterium]|nr:1-deoxy-D-xylulose-5-phosphate reductoisomerase [Rhabdochlamydiaceae bacterium]